MSINRQYPIGTMFEAIEGQVDYDKSVKSIGRFPSEMRQRVAKLSKVELALTYRENSWDIKTLVHHCADSHMHALLRLKWALSEDIPEIKGYDEGITATFRDYLIPIETSLSLLDGLHARMEHLLASLSPAERNRMYVHTGHNETFTIKETAAMYAWHGEHHLAHIDLALGRLQ